MADTIFPHQDTNHSYYAHSLEGRPPEEWRRIEALTDEGMGMILRELLNQEDK